MAIKWQQFQPIICVQYDKTKKSENKIVYYRQYKLETVKVIIIIYNNIHKVPEPCKFYTNAACKACDWCMIKVKIRQHIKFCETIKTSLLRQLQAQTLLNATPPTGKIDPFCKIAVTLTPLMQNGCPSRLKIS